MTTFREILLGITRHRANPVQFIDPDVQRKCNEIEWALQALAEKLAEHEESDDGGN